MKTIHFLKYTLLFVVNFRVIMSGIKCNMYFFINSVVEDKLILFCHLFFKNILTGFYMAFLLYLQTVNIKDVCDNLLLYL